MVRFDGPAKQAVLRIVEDYETGNGPFAEADRQLPIVEVTDGMTFANGRKKALFLTLSTSLNYQRDARRLRERCRALWETERWIFEPETLVGDDRYGELRALFKGTGPYSDHPIVESHGRMERGVRDVDIWYTNAWTLYEKYDADPRALLADCQYDAVALLDRIASATYSRPVHPESFTTKQFPYLGGAKIGPLWLRIMHEMVHPLANIEDVDGIPIPVDTHVARVTNYLLGTDLEASADQQEIQEIWRSFCQEHGLATVQVDKPIWLLGTMWNDGGKAYLESVVAEVTDRTEARDGSKPVSTDGADGATAVDGGNTEQLPVAGQPRGTSPRERLGAAATAIVEEYEADRGPFDQPGITSSITETLATDRDKALFLTFSTALNRQRDAARLYTKCERLWHEQPWIFEPADLVEEHTFDELATLFDARGMRFGRKDAEVWYEIGRTLHRDYDDDPMNLLEAADYDMEQLSTLVRTARGDARFFKGGYLFPGLRGDKIRPLWLRLISNQVAPLAHRDRSEIPVDTHIIQITERVCDVELTKASRDKRRIREFWRTICEPYEIDPIDVDGPLWYINRNWAGWGRTYFEEALATENLELGAVPFAESGSQSTLPTDCETDENGQLSNDTTDEDDSSSSPPSRLDLLLELLGLHQDYGRVPDPSDLPEDGRITEAHYRREFGSWEAALEEINLQ